MATGSSSLGIGRVLIAAYAVLAFASFGRAGYELAAKFNEAPLPYALSAFSAVIYIVATFTLPRRGANSRKIAWVAVSIELIGVITVGLASLIWPEVFTFAGKQVRTVWSFFGIAYGFVPLVLPVLGLLWLRKTAVK